MAVITINKDNTNREIIINDYLPAYVRKLGKVEGLVVLPTCHYRLGKINDEWVITEADEYLDAENIQHRGWVYSDNDFEVALNFYNSMVLNMSVTPEGFEGKEIEEYEDLQEKFSSLIEPLMEAQNYRVISELLEQYKTQDKDFIGEAVVKYLESENPKWAPERDEDTRCSSYEDIPG